MRRQRGVDLTSPPLSSGLARRVAAPEVTASAGAGGLAPYRCPWSWVVLGTGLQVGLGARVSPVAVVQEGASWEGSRGGKPGSPPGDHYGLPAPHLLPWVL